MNIKNVRGQFWSIDVIFAIVIFGVAITILSYTWYSVNNQLSLAVGSGSIIAQLQASTLADSLFSTGYPTSWQSSINTSNSSSWRNISVGLSGIASSTNLSISKIYALVAMSNTNYQATKQRLGVGYDYYIILKGNSVNITIGRNPATHQALSVYIERRNAFVNGIPVSVEVLVWTNTTLAVS